MTEINNKITVSDEDRSKRRKKKKSKNNRRELFPTHEINEVNNTKGKTVNNNNHNFTHQTAVTDKLVNKRPKEKKESNTKLVGNRADNNNLSTFYRRKNRKIHYSVVDVQQFNAIEHKPCTIKKRITADRAKKESNENSKKKLCENANNKKNHQNNLQLSTEKFNERSEKSFITRTINNIRLNNTKNNQFSHFKSQNNTHKLFPIHTKSYDTKTKISRTTTYYIEIQRPGHVNEPSTINNDTVNVDSSDLEKRDKIWDFYSHNGQNTYSINNCNGNNQTILNNVALAENRRKNEHTTIKNSELPIAEPSRADYGNPEPRIRSSKKCTDRETIRKNHRALLKYPVTNFCDSKCNNYFIDDENPEEKKPNDDDTCNNNKVSETCSTRDKNTVEQTSSNDPYDCKANNTLSSSSCDDQNEYEGSENDSNDNIKYNSKCMGNKVYFTNKNGNNWTAASLRYDHRKESNTEIEDNNHNDNDTQIDRGVVNFHRFVKQFDKIWENVIQEISGC